MGMADLLELLWPYGRCLLCGDRLQGLDNREGAYICAKCREKLAAYARCPRCGGLAAAGRPYHLCDGTGPDLLGMLAAVPYAGLLRRELLELKYSGRRRLAGPMGAMLAWAWRQTAPDFVPEVVVPVPLHSRRQQQRGYNQSELLARAFAGHFGLPVAAGLVRLRDTEAQHKLTLEERARNVEGAFALSGAGELAGRRVLLIDDIITSGATVRSCAAVLKQAGCREVYAAAVAGRSGCDSLQA